MYAYFLIWYKYSEAKHWLFFPTLYRLICGSISVPLFTGMGYDGILSSLLQMKHIYSLIDNQEMKGWTAAHLAALRNRAGCLAVLIGRAADVYTVTDKVM